MSDRTPIEWTSSTWNPVVGCSPVSAGCQHCYASRMAHRFPARYGGLTRLGPNGPAWTGDARFVPEALRIPLQWRNPRWIFVCSMGDLFHPAVTNEQIAAVFGVMAACPRHTFQLLTKRPERMRRWLLWMAERPSGLLGMPYAPKLVCAGHAQTVTGLSWTVADPGAWPLPNVWVGISCEDQGTASARIPPLLQTPVALRFVSLEPLLGPMSLSPWLDLGFCTKCGHAGRCRRTRLGLEHDGCNYLAAPLKSLHWVIVGGETGPGARPMQPDRVRSIRDQCLAAGVPFFFKSWGDWAPADQVLRPGESTIGHRVQGGMVRVGKKRAGATLDGREWKEFPK